MKAAEFDYIPVDNLHEKYVDYGDKDHATSETFNELGY